ncbi:glycosyltransferase family 2 protein [Clostridium sp. Marseille-P299]|uniref:glycosyltransferase family 2 protein n=1 Tax=Clostridium sp. Marseille-P299 TaxID=1805477 RepID=UPI000834A51B|nr:glycosyltransferase [Clostridium sp. Marseille-P299]
MEGRVVKVSVIVPVYNTQEYLRDCLLSLVMQSLNEIEIIVVNDGSTDNSLEIIESFAMDYPDKFVVLTKENGGQATARNLGIQYATGEYIGFVDSDDFVHPDMYQEMYDVAVASDCDFVECDFEFLKIKNNKLIPLKKRGKTRKFLNQADMFLDPMVAPWNDLYKSSVLKNSGVLFPEGYIYEDTSFYIKMIPFIKKSEFIDKVFVYHMYRETSTMNTNKSKKVADIFSVLDDIVTFYKENNFWSEYQAEVEYFCSKILLCSSMRRISLVRNKELRSFLIEQTSKMLSTQFSEYKKNPYLQQGLKSKYMKSITKKNIHLFCNLFYLHQKLRIE